MGSPNFDHQGVFILGTDKLHNASCSSAIQAALAAGYRTIDTAQAYRNEQDVGEAIRTSGVPREEVFVTTKISDGYLKNPASFQEAYESALGSIKRLDVAYVDLLLIHAPGDSVDARRFTWQALERLVDEGFIKRIGVSNYGVEHIAEMEQYAKIYPPDVNQIELHPWCQQREIVEFCMSQGIKVQASCSLVRNRKSTHPGLCEVARKYGKTTAQLLVRYSLQRGWSPVLKSENPVHLNENADVYDFSIQETDMALLNSWDEGRNGAILKAILPQVGGE